MDDLLACRELEAEPVEAARVLVTGSRLKFQTDRPLPWILGESNG